MKKIVGVILFFSVAISFMAHGRQFDIYRKVFPRQDVVLCTTGYIGLAAGIFYLIEGIKGWQKMRQSKKSGKKLMLHEEKNIRDATTLIWVSAIFIPLCALFSSVMTYCLYWSYILRDKPLFSLKNDGLYTHYSGKKPRKLCNAFDIADIEERIDEYGNSFYIVSNHKGKTILEVKKSDIDGTRTVNDNRRIVEVNEVSSDYGDVD